MIDHHKRREPTEPNDADEWLPPDIPGFRSWPGTPSYIRELNKAVERDRAELEAKKQEREKDRAERFAPLEIRLAKFLSTIPEARRQEGLSIAELQPRLVGRHRGHARSGDIGAAMRKLGYIRVRCWHRSSQHGDSGFRALWYPPPKPGE